MSKGEHRAMLLSAWAMLILGFAGAIASVSALNQGNGSAPNPLAVFLVFATYIAAAMLLQITGKARLVIIVLFLPALFDVAFGGVVTFGNNPDWQTEITWRALRVLLSLFVVPLSLGVGLWLEKDDADRSVS